MLKLTFKFTLCICIIIRSLNLCNLIREFSDFYTCIYSRVNWERVNIIFPPSNAHYLMQTRGKRWEHCTDRGHDPHIIYFKDIWFTCSFVVILRYFLKYFLLPYMSKTVIFHAFLTSCWKILQKSRLNIFGQNPRLQKLK